MRRPITSTYRLQLRGPAADPQGRAFGFAEAAAQVPYLRSLGVSHLYLSPIFTADQASNHNYDVIDPTTINPELGGIEGLRELARTAHDAGLGLVLDIVPNHLGVKVPRTNKWWWDVLKHGKDSEFAPYFDIDWHEDNGAGGKLGLPVLGREGDEGKLRLAHLSAEDFPDGIASDDADGEDVLQYFDHSFPLAPGTYTGLDDDPIEVYHRQSYRLMYWRDGVISYRRFFSVNDLAGVRVEDPLVFEHTHRVLRQLIAEELIDGIRVDHPDGLADPFEYLTRLRDLIGQDRWLVVEKILSPDEPLDPRLNVDGTTGYDALRELDGVFVYRGAERALGDQALARSGARWDAADIHAAERELKRKVASDELWAEIRRLVRAIRRDNFSTAGQDVSDADLADTLMELVSAIPVYRADYRSLSRITASVMREMSREFPQRSDALDLIAAALLSNGEAKTRVAQVCGAVMAKGVEDTLFYRASRLVALQEVGGAPSMFGVGPAEFHLLQQERAELWPAAMTTLTTHDTKRSEDTRARMIEIAEVAEEYAALTEQVFALAPPPDSATGHFLLQNVVGVWPEDGEITDELHQRLHDYATKAAREAGVNTTWFDQDADFEERAAGWIDALLEEPVAAAITDFVGPVSRGGVAVSLGRKTLQLAGAGIADTYQGQEFIDLSLVDPDNRRFVDFRARGAALDAYLAAHEADFNARAYLTEGQVSEAGDGATGQYPWLRGRGADLAKQLVTREGLQLRREFPDIFVGGSHQAVFAVGEADDHLVGIARGGAAAPGSEEGFGVIGVATRLPIRLARRGGWGETTVQLPEGEWTDRYTGRSFSGVVRVAELLDTLPAALLVSTRLTEASRL